MNKFRLLRSPQLNRRLLIYMITLILLSCLTVGMISYYIAKKELDNKGKIILKNGVEMALLLIESKNEEVLEGTISIQEAQEQVKTELLGEKNEDGTRNIKSNIDLGENGYFMAYSQTGVEIMHPNLEGQDVWNVTDRSKNSFLLVQDQVSKAKEGGGYSYYTWNLPNSEKLGKKVAYSKLDPAWGWVVTASAYSADYNKGANSIMNVMFFVTISLLLIGIYVSISYIKGITRPLENVVGAMRLAEKGIYSSINGINRKDEIGELVSGFNEMVASINNAHQDLICQEEKISYLAYYDQLSEIPNRNKFKEHVNKRIKDGIKNAQIVLLDIKDFNLINSILGNEFGDKIIKTIGYVFKKYQSDEYFFARLSGNEFAGWIENSSESLIKEYVEYFRALFNDEIKNIGFNQKIYFHISYSVYPDNGADFESLYKKATIALKFAKENSPTRIFNFEKSMEESIEQEARIISYVEEAINEDEFTVYYQNKVSIRDNKVVGVEALARWNSKILGFVSPAVFIPVIDKANLTARFSKVIIDKVLMDYTKLEKKFQKDITVSINISPLFFFEKDFTAIIIEAISNSGVNPNNVILEITEDIFINDFDTIQKIIAELKSFGVKISLDDFGTGYSSLNYIKNIDFDELKIDRTFMKDLLTDERVLKLLKSIDQIAKAYDYSVIAEGVETQAQLEKVQEAGFDIVQGFIYSKPEPL